MNLSAVIELVSFDKALEFTANVWMPTSLPGVTSGKTPAVTASAACHVASTSVVTSMADTKSPVAVSTGSIAPEPLALTEHPASHGTLEYHKTKQETKILLN